MLIPKVVIADMLTIIPNVAENYTQNLFNGLKPSQAIAVRKTTLTLLGVLFTRKVLKTENQIHYIAECLLDKSKGYSIY